MFKKINGPQKKNKSSRHSTCSWMLSLFLLNSIYITLVIIFACSIVTLCELTWFVQTVRVTESVFIVKRCDAVPIFLSVTWRQRNHDLFIYDAWSGNANFQFHRNFGFDHFQSSKATKSKTNKKLNGWNIPYKHVQRSYIHAGWWTE